MGGVQRPVVRYHGGKWELAPWIIGHFAPHKIYVEPFGGGASVLLRKARSYSEVYNDIDGEVVNLFRVLREQHEELAARCSMTPFARDDFSAAFEDVECSPLDRAWKTLVRSHMGFAGAGTLFRKTGFRSFSINSGSHPAKQWALFPEHIACIGERLRGVVIEHADACDVMVQQDTPETLHYVDPPYMAETRDKGADYRHELNDDAHRKLAAVLRGLRGKVIVSGYPSDTYEEDFKGWRRVEREAQAERARLRTEVLWMNYDAPDADLFGLMGGGGRGVSEPPTTEAKENEGGPTGRGPSVTRDEVTSQ